MPTQYQLEKMRAQARKAGYTPASDKKKTITKPALSQAEKDKIYYTKYQTGKSKVKDTRDISTLGKYSVAKPSTVSKDSGLSETEKLIQRLRKKPRKYLK